MISSGIGKAGSELNAFDRALMNSGVGNYNLLKVSSILPKGAIKTDLISLEQGDLLPIAYAHLTSEPCNDDIKRISAAVAIGIPINSESVGVIMEWSGYELEDIARTKVVQMVKTAMNDRDIKNYRIEIESSSDYTSVDDYVCVFAGVSIINKRANSQAMSKQ